MPAQAIKVRFDALPPFSPVIVRLLQLMGGDNMNMRQAAELINSDPSLAAQVLRLANSPLFGFQREVTSLLVALNLLGLDRVYSMAITASLKRLSGKVARWPAARHIWRHSLATAYLAADLSLDHYRDMSEDYTAGLLHDIGRLILLASGPAEYSALLEEAEARDLDSRRLETGCFGLTHEEAGGLAMRRFGFPESLVVVAEFHHRVGESPSHRATVELIHACSETASSCGYAVVAHRQQEMPEDDLCLYLRERMLETERSLIG
jgi:HD-like signal output (HDOD) protein